MLAKSVIYSEDSLFSPIMPNLTYNARLIFSKAEDFSAVREVLEWHRDATNEALRKHFGAEKNSIVDLHRAFYYPYRENNQHVPSQVIIKAEQECLQNYRSVKSNGHDLTAPPVKKNLAMRLDIRTFAYKNGDISLISSGKRVKCKLQSYAKLDELLGKHRFLDPLIFLKDNELWMSITFDIPELPRQVRQTDTCVGVDLGKRIAAVTSEGKFYEDKVFNKQKRQLRHLKDALKTKASAGSRSAKKHLHKLRRKEKNKNKNQTHALANRILSEAQGTVIALEDLKGLKVKKNKFQNKNSISQTPFAELRTVLTYKAPVYGKTVITVNPRFTSQTDHRTGKREGVRQGRRFTGLDGVTLDADHNAAVNIALRTKLPVSEATVLRGSVLDGQAVVTRPNGFSAKADNPTSVNLKS